MCHRGKGNIKGTAPAGDDDDKASPEGDAPKPEAPKPEAPKPEEPKKPDAPKGEPD